MLEYLVYMCVCAFMTMSACIAIVCASIHVWLHNATHTYTCCVSVEMYVKCLHCLCTCVHVCDAPMCSVNWEGRHDISEPQG